MDNLIDKIESLADNYRRDVSVTFVHRHHAWRAECAGEVVQSIVGPEDSLELLKEILDKSNRSKDPTRFEPAVGGNNGKDADV